MIDLRLIGMFWTDRPMKDVSSRFLPFVWWPLLILFATGAIMVIGEPARSLKNPAFQVKMMLLVAALIVTGLIQSLGTAWGLFRHYWVLIKLLIAILATVVLLVHMQPIGDMARVAAERTLMSADLRGPVSAG
jgi:hypothetical protein